MYDSGLQIYVNSDRTIGLVKMKTSAIILIGWADFTTIVFINERMVGLSLGRNARNNLNGLGRFCNDRIY